MAELETTPKESTAGNHTAPSGPETQRTGPTDAPAQTHTAPANAAAFTESATSPAAPSAASPNASSTTSSPEDAAQRPPLDAGQIEALTEQIVEAIKTCYDPEIPVNIYDMGLIYNIDISPDARVTVLMTLTSPACPVAGSLPPEVEAKVRAVEGVADARVEVVWDPPWSMDRMTDAAKLQLGFM